MKVFFLTFGPKCSLFTQTILWRKPRIWQCSKLSISINECTMNVEATAETERLHTLCLWIYSALLEERPWVCVWEPLTHTVLHILTSLNSTQNTSQQCQKVDNCRNLHIWHICFCMTQVQWSSENYAFTCYISVNGMYRMYF